MSSSPEEKLIGDLEGVIRRVDQLRASKLRFGRDAAFIVLVEAKSRLNGGGATLTRKDICDIMRDIFQANIPEEQFDSYIHAGRERHKKAIGGIPDQLRSEIIAEAKALSYSVG